MSLTVEQRFDNLSGAMTRMINAIAYAEKIQFSESFTTELKLVLKSKWRGQHNHRHKNMAKVKRGNPYRGGVHKPKWL